MEKLELFYLYRISGALTLHNPVSGQTEGRRELAQAELTKDGFMIKNPKQSSALWTDSGFGNGIKTIARIISAQTEPAMSGSLFDPFDAVFTC